MSTTLTEKPNTTTEMPQSDPPRWVWHHAATWEDLVAALVGKPYTARCGKRCHGVPGKFRHRSTLAPIEQCVVCRDLIAGGSPP
jgi:hypothetical protein